MNKELIERLREAAASRVASTAMIGADDLIAADDALESLDAAYSGAVEAGKALAKQALKAERERDAFEKAAGEEAKKYLEEREKRIAAEAERDALAAELKALREQKPVARIDDDESFQGPCRHAMAFVPMHRGAPLYAHPVPAKKLTDIVNDLSQQIRKINGNNSMGACALAEGIAEWADKRLKGEGDV